MDTANFSSNTRQIRPQKFSRRIILNSRVQPISRVSRRDAIELLCWLFFRFFGFGLPEVPNLSTLKNLFRLCGVYRCPDLGWSHGCGIPPVKGSNLGSIESVVKCDQNRPSKSTRLGPPIQIGLSFVIDP